MQLSKVYLKASLIFIELIGYCTAKVYYGTTYQHIRHMYALYRYLSLHATLRGFKVRKGIRGARVAR